MILNKIENIPALVTCDQFKLLLRENFPEYSELLNFIAFRALNNGENYITTIIRIRADIKLKNESHQKVQFILKVPLQINYDRNNEDQTHDEYEVLFITESEMYEKIVPELEKLYANVGVSLQFKPKNYKFSHEMRCKYILMEDLQIKKFQNISRLDGLDVMHTQSVLAKLAQWHAASARRVEIQGDYPEEYRKSYISEDNLELINSMNEAFNEPFEQCIDIFGLFPREKDIILSYMQNMNELYLKFGSIDEQAFNVLNHGDFWINNIMFQHKDNNEALLNEVLFVDFQLPKYGTFAMDLFCFLMTSPQWGIKLKKFDSFVEYYYLELVKNLKILQYEKSIPTIDALRSQMEKSGLWAFVCVQRMLAVALLDPHDNSNIETFMSNNEEGKAFKKRMFYNPLFIQQVKEILPWLIEKNYLHYLTQIS